MRTFKITALFVLFLIAVAVTYLTVVYPRLWYSDVRRESLRVLSSAKTIEETTNAIGSLGLFLQLTNGSWIAIRYNDTHSGSVISSAVAKDSEGKWFESDRHFCGSLQAWPRHKDEAEGEEEIKKMDPGVITNQISRKDMKSGSFPSYREMEAIESAPTLEAAREALQKIGFKPMEP